MGSNELEAELGKNKSVRSNSELEAQLSAKDKARQNALAAIKKEYGSEAIMILGKQNIDQTIEVISTGSLALDVALGTGGLPLGRICEIYGPESSGKTTIALSLIAQAQKRDPEAHCAIIDTEHALDIVYAQQLGVDLKRMHISQPPNAEEALEIMDSLVRSRGFDVVILDSVAALVPKAELEGDMGDAHMGLQARLMSQALRKLTASISKSKTLVLFINQIRQKIGVMFGSPETTTGGNALKFYSSVRLDIRKTETLKIGDKPIGNRVKVKVVKNKVGTPFQVAELIINFGQGIDKMAELIDFAVLHNVIDKSGSWYSFNNMKIGQGKDSVKQYLLDNPNTFNIIEEKIREIAKNNVVKINFEELSDEKDELE